MKRQIWIPLALGIVATYIFLDRRAARYAAEYDELDAAADRTDLWGSKQRIEGTGRDFLGKVKETVGRVTGDDVWPGAAWSIRLRARCRIRPAKQRMLPATRFANSITT